MNPLFPGADMVQPPTNKHKSRSNTSRGDPPDSSVPIYVAACLLLGALLICLLAFNTGLLIALEAPETPTSTWAQAAPQTPPGAASSTQADEGVRRSATLHAWQLIGEDGKRIVRAALPDNGPCPYVMVDGERTRMSARLPQSPDQFTAAVCEIEVEPEADLRFDSGWMFPPLPKRYQRVVVVGDTGCRLTFYQSQACKDREKWPFARVAGLAASKKPDLVIHVGDYHYREKPCHRGKGCEGAAWGDRWEAWWEDFFWPAGPLLNETPWVFVRGNHEDCERAGAGWFQFFGPRVLAVRKDNCSDFIAPYALRFEPALDLLVFDNSAKDPRPYDDRGTDGLNIWLDKDDHWSKAQSPGNDRTNRAQIALMHRALADYRQVAAKPRSAPAETCPQNAEKVQPPKGDEDLLKAIREVVKNRWNPQTVFSGHLHSFQSVQRGEPLHQIVIGNGGTDPDRAEWPEELWEDYQRMTCHAYGERHKCPTGSWRGDGTEHIAVAHDFGFLVLDLLDGAGWFGRVYNLKNDVVAACALPFERDAPAGSSPDMQPFTAYAEAVDLPKALFGTDGLTGRGCVIVPPNAKVSTAGTL
jgi:Calcineurin-like phosphoesterase